jgi:hypothetical protein
MDGWSVAHRRAPAALAMAVAVVVGFFGAGVPVSPAGAALPPATADAVPFIGTFPVQCTMGNPSPGGVCASHHSYVGAVDIGMPVGTPVRAAGPGTVVFVNDTCSPGDSGCQGGAGRWVGVRHADGKVSRYLHLADATVSEDQVVARGAVLGTSGTTGNALVAHLHYDEQEPLFTRTEMGRMVACHGSNLVVYPDAWGHDEWRDVPYGSMLRNDGYGCLGDLFLDVPPGHGFFTEITWMAAEELTSGFPDGTFRPEASVTRQAISAWLHRLAGDPDGPFADPGFLDVPASHAFAREIWWMADTGRSTGYADSTYRPVSCVSRQATAAFLYREAGSPPGPFPDPGFSDVGPAHAFAVEIRWMAHAEVTGGFPDGTFRPGACVSRQAAAAFLHRLLG